MNSQDTGSRIQDAGCAESTPAVCPQPASPPAPKVKYFGIAEYEPTWHAMRNFTTRRKADTRDEIWMLQHPPTYTQGQAGLPEHLLNAKHIPVVQIDRGGQITYHGPGQIVAYLLLDLRHWKLNVRQLVRLMEQTVINILAEHDIKSSGREDAPGVYVGDAKIAALGLKIKRGCCYHGLSFNINMDLTPYNFINPCGYKGLHVTQLKDFGIDKSPEQIEQLVAAQLLALLAEHHKEASKS